MNINSKQTAFIKNKNCNKYTFLEISVLLSPLINLMYS